MAGDTEEECSESSRKMKDMEETTSGASWTAAIKGKEKEVWRLEPEGEAEEPEATGLGSEVKDFFVEKEGKWEGTLGRGCGGSECEKESE